MSKTNDHRQEHALPDVTVRLCAHGCLEIEYAGFRLLCDPWLVGPALLGACIAYPPPAVTAGALAPDAILVTHEHSDHFHEPTLDEFPRTTPVLVPDYPNQRIPRILQQMGFADVRVLRFGELTAVGEDLSITAYEPAGHDNDAICLIEAAGLRILNVNDAAANARIAPFVRPVDVVAAAASTHADRESPEERLATLRQMLAMYGAARFLPTGSYAALWDPVHRPLLKKRRRLRLKKMARLLQGTATLLPLLPGSRWIAQTDVVEHAGDGREPKRAEMLNYIRRMYDADLAAVCRQPSRAVTRDDLTHYFLRLNHSPDIALCEDTRVRVAVLDDDTGEPALEMHLVIEAGRLGIAEQPLREYDLHIKLRRWAISKVVLEDLSWDELRLGHWLDLRGAADGFWRVLQAPYYRRRLTLVADDGETITQQSTVAQIVRRGGDHAERILRRYGLYLRADSRAGGASLANIAAEHALDSKTADRLLGELRRACA